MRAFSAIERNIAVSGLVFLSMALAPGRLIVTHAAPDDISCPVAVRFSPNGGAQDAVTETLRRAHARIYVAVYAFTNSAIEAALVDRAREGVRIALTADRRQSAGEGQAAVLSRLRAAGVAVEVSRSRGLLHDKFAVVDGRWVITGSFNWTTSAERHNRDNVLILDCPSLASRYEAEWERITSARP